MPAQRKRRYSISARVSDARELIEEKYLMADTETHVPQVGSMAPDFTLPAGNGSRVALADLRGKTVLLYFYPKDDTPGCTTEACGFRDSWGALQAKGVVVLGVS